MVVHGEGGGEAWGGEEVGEEGPGLPGFVVCVGGGGGVGGGVVVGGGEAAARALLLSCRSTQLPAVRLWSPTVLVSS